MNKKEYPIYKLTLHKTYYEKGFFNLRTEVDNYIKKDNGKISIYLGESKEKIEGKLNRNANLNHTPRIYGKQVLKGWFQKYFNLKDVVFIYILSENEIWIKQ